MAPDTRLQTFKTMREGLMKIMPCPLNGPRNISEFVYGGEVSALPDVESAADSEWAEHTFYAYNGTGVAREWWYHTASGYWFVAERHRVTDEILRTYDPSELEDMSAVVSDPNSDPNSDSNSAEKLTTPVSSSGSSTEPSNQSGEESES